MEREITRIVDHRIENGEEIFLVQWKNSWIRASQLKNCRNLLRKFTVKRRKKLRNKEYEVEKILDRRITEDGVEEFLVKWKDYNESSNSWEPRRNFINCRMLLQNFLEYLNIAPQELESVLDRRIVEGEIYYHIRYKDRENPSKLTSAWVNKSELFRISCVLDDYERERASKENPDTSTTSSSDDSSVSDESSSE